MDTLIFVGALWGVYVTVVSINFAKPFKIHKNLLSSWSAAKLTSKVIYVDGIDYARFSLQDYKNVPRIFWLIRFHHRVFILLLGLGGFLFFLFYCLGIFTAVAIWQAVGSNLTQLPSDKAQILLSGHIIVFFSTMGIFPFFRYFENLYLDYFYTISDKGLREKNKAEKNYN